MSISYASNVASLRLSTKLKQTASQLSTSYERLSSGQRINKATDDPAGLALADKLNNESRLMTVAIRNANDALSLTNIADAALGEINNVLSRMSELATQAASSGFTAAQRSVLQTEFVALGSEVDRISTAVTFNSIQLLSNSSNQVAQVGITADTFSQMTIPSVLGTLAVMGLGQGSRLTYSLTGTTVNFGVSAARNAMTALANAIDNITQQRGVIGATQSRLSAAVNTLTVTRENTIAAESQIRETDVATEASQLLRLQVLQQAQTALLAQSNQQPSRILAVLGL
jgi:flagellin